MKLMPASRALATMRDDVASSVGPPNIMVPRHIGEIFRPLRPSWRYCMGWVLAYVSDKHTCQSSSLRAKRSNPCLSEENMDCFVALAMTALTLAFQYLEHAARHRDTAFVDGHLGGDENQTACEAHHMRLRHQNLADLAGFDKVRIELHGRQRRLARDEAGGHAAGAVGEGHDHAALHQAAAVVVLVLGGKRVFVRAVGHAL